MWNIHDLATACRDLHPRKQGLERVLRIIVHTEFDHKPKQFQQPICQIGSISVNFSEKNMSKHSGETPYILARTTFGFRFLFHGCSNLLCHFGP